MKYIKRIINFVYFIGIVMALCIATMYVIALTGNGLVNGFKSMSSDDWFYGLIMLFLILPLWRRIDKFYKPIFEPEDYNNFLTMINMNIVSPIVEKSQLQEETLNVIYKKHRVEIDDICETMKKKAKAGIDHCFVEKKKEEEIYWLISFFRMKGFQIEILHDVYGVTFIRISW